MHINSDYHGIWHNRRTYSAPVRKNWIQKASDLGCDTTEEVRSRILAVNSKANKLRTLVLNKSPIVRKAIGKAQTKAEPTAAASKKLISAKSMESKNRSKISARLLHERIEPTAMAFGLPNFSTQPEVSYVATRADNLNHLFSHVDLLRFKLENVSAIAYKIFSIGTSLVLSPIVRFLVSVSIVALSV